MKILYDYFPIYFKESDAYELFLSIIKSEGKFNEPFLLIDSYMEFNKIKLESLLSCSIHIVKKDINRETNTSLQIENILKDYDGYTCFNNGLSIPKNTVQKCRVFISNLLPLFNNSLENTSFQERYLHSFENIIKNSYEIEVFCNFHRKLLIEKNINSEKIKINSPDLSVFYSNIDKELSILYLLSKFNIDYKFFLLIGSCNEGFNLDYVINFYRNFKEKSKVKFIFLMRSVGSATFNNFKRKIVKEIGGIVFEKFSLLDEVNFIGACEAIVDFSSPYIISLSTLKGMKMKRKIITDMNFLNLEWLEDYPIYYNGEEFSLDYLDVELN